MRTLGSVLLKRWREGKGLTQLQAGGLLSLSQGAVCDLERGRRGTGREKAILIAKGTKGAVPIDSWSQSAPAEGEASNG